MGWFCGVLLFTLAGCIRTPPPQPPIVVNPAPMPAMSLTCSVVGTMPGWAPTAVDGLSVRTGDSIQFQLTVNPAANVYLLHIGSSGSGTALLPQSAGADANIMLMANVPTLAPVAGRIRVAPPAGEERLIFVASQLRVPEIDALVGRGKLSGSDIDRAVAQAAARNAPDYRMTKTVGYGNRVDFQAFTAYPYPILIADVTMHHLP